MRKEFDRELEKKIDVLRTRFPKYSPQEEAILRIGWNIRSACNSLMPNSYLFLAQDKVDTYEKAEGANPEIVSGLWDVINSAWDLYGEAEAVIN